MLIEGNGPGNAKEGTALSQEPLEVLRTGVLHGRAVPWNESGNRDSNELDAGIVWDVS